MEEAESTWVLIAGVVGLLGFAGGSLVTALPRPDRDLDVALAAMVRRRTAVLAGSVASASGAALLLWPISAVATAGNGEAWPSLALFSVVVAALTMAFVVVVAVLIAALAWRDPTDLPAPTARTVLDGAHLAIWSVSAPLAAVMVVSTTVVGVQNDLVGPPVVVAAVAKVVTVCVEVAGLTTRRGWNAGGWAAGSSGYATVAWFALLLVDLS